MDFKNLPLSYRLVRLNESELADAIDGWLQREHPNVARIGSLEANATFIANVPIKVSTATVSPDAHLKPTPKKEGVSRKRLNAGIGKDLRLLFADGIIHDLGTVYTILKPKYPHLTRNKLQHNFYAVPDIVNLGENKWQALKIN